MVLKFYVRPWLPARKTEFIVRRTNKRQCYACLDNMFDYRYNPIYRVYFEDLM